MISMMKHLVIFACLISASFGLRWPKIYKNDMVLQASPTTAVLWGFLDGNQNPVEMTGECVLHGKSKKLISKFVPKEVNSTIHKIIQIQSLIYNSVLRMMTNSPLKFLKLK